MKALPSFDLTGQIALVTGAARGLGRAISLALAEAGADVAIGLKELGRDAGLEAEIVARRRRVRRNHSGRVAIGRRRRQPRNSQFQFSRWAIALADRFVAEFQRRRAFRLVNLVQRRAKRDAGIDAHGQATAGSTNVADGRFVPDVDGL